MATAKNTPKLLEPGRWHPSLRRLVIFASFALNIGFIVVLLAVATSTALDGLFMPTALDRYCSTANDDKFQKEDAKVKAMRTYVCDRTDAHTYFIDGYYKYLDSLKIPYTRPS
jgi:hypothetical protein